jgi:phosphomannomutase
MKFNPNIFKAYDIRGIFNQDLDANFAYHLGLTYIAFLKKERKILKNKQIQVVVGQDMRLSSPILAKYLIKGLMATGAKVLDIGLVSTPTFYFSISHLKADGGLIVSASHNPKEWNGFKVVKEKALPVGLETGLSWIRDNINKTKNTSKKGSSCKINHILEAQIEHDFSFVNLKKIKKFKIAADAANSMGAPYLLALEKKLKFKLDKLNFKLDGNFPAHEADPLKEENLKQLQSYIKKNKVDLGITTDGDGDRIFFLDEKANLISPAIIRGILAKLFLQEKPGSKICYDVRPGKITEDLILENGGIPIITKVGHSLIKQQMIKEKAYFAGESSGHFFLNLNIGCFEMPVIMILKLLEELSISNLKTSQYFSPYDKYFHSGEINRQVENKEDAIEEIANYYCNGELNRLDGISIKYPNFWFNVRASNTENKLRLNLEARDKKTMIKETNKLLKLMEK